MKVVEGQLASIIEEILFEKQAVACWRGLHAVVPSEAAANDAVFVVSSEGEHARKVSFRDLFVFFAEYAKNCAKFALDLSVFAKLGRANKRRRIPLAACFFGLFSVPVHNFSSANLSTTP
ncbi:hypothetical protein [Trinickia sp.]|uniref:hypothetical protein n=1 Tax=Trinickia sp. TaxID=2571163 RepID=UPI003F7E5295